MNEDALLRKIARLKRQACYLLNNTETGELQYRSLAFQKHVREVEQGYEDLPGILHRLTQLTEISEEVLLEVGEYVAKLSKEENIPLLLEKMLIFLDEITHMKEQKTTKEVK